MTAYLEKFVGRLKQGSDFSHREQAKHDARQAAMTAARELEEERQARERAAKQRNQITAGVFVRNSRQRVHPPMKD